MVAFTGMRRRIHRHLIRQNRLPPYLIFLVRGSQQPAIMLKILPMNKLLHSDPPGEHRLNVTALPLP